nr:hypothetical protein [Enterococcus innesii]
MSESPGQENISAEAKAIRDKVRADSVKADDIAKGTMNVSEEYQFRGKTLVIWTKDGKTLYFENVTNFTDGLIETGDRRIAFNYSGVSTGVNRYANFNTRAIMGFALEK